jgi:predicted RNA-binding protein YlqC (UPF0109 family)
LEALIQYLTRALVDHPERVELHVSDVDGGRLIEVRVAPEDIGKVIGRDGRTVNAMRTLLAALAQKKGIKARLEVLDDRRPQVPAEPPPAG